MLVLAIAAFLPVPSGSADDPGNGTNAIGVHVHAGGVHEIAFIFDADIELYQNVQPNNLPALEVYPALLDFYIVSGSDPTIENVPSFMAAVLGNPTHENCIGSLDGYLLCWHDPGTPTTVYQREILDTTDVVAVGEGCVIVTYHNGNPPTIIDDIPLVASGALTPGEACPA